MSMHKYSKYTFPTDMIHLKLANISNRILILKRQLTSPFIYLLLYT